MADGLAIINLIINCQDEIKPN
jgi:diacylglycerol O-acyltransferase